MCEFQGPDADRSGNAVFLVVDRFQRGELEVNVSASDIGTAHEAFGAGEPLAEVGMT